MKLPNSDKVIISQTKLLDYILSETHSTGKFKAKFFRDFGFNETNVNLLKKALQRIAQSFDIKEEIKILYGTKYIIEGEIISPKGRIIFIRTVWIIEINQNQPRFITAYPV